MCKYEDKWENLKNKKNTAFLIGFSQENFFCKIDNERFSYLFHTYMDTLYMIISNNMIKVKITPDNV